MVFKLLYFYLYRYLFICAGNTEDTANKSGAKLRKEKKRLKKNLTESSIYSINFARTKIIFKVSRDRFNNIYCSELSTKMFCRILIRKLSSYFLV